MVECKSQYIALDDVLFSGPDLCKCVFSNASTYILSGKEIIGQVPDHIDRVARSQSPENEVSLGLILSVSFFITVNMRADSNYPLNGTPDPLRISSCSGKSSATSVGNLTIQETCKQGMDS